MRPSRLPSRQGRRLSMESLERRDLLSVSEPNNTPETAVFVPDIYLESQYFASDTVNSATDHDDYFAFYNLYGPSHLYAALYGLSADADLYVYNGNKQLMLSSTAGGNISENIQLDLPAGDYYYVRVAGFSGSTPYNLLLENDYAGSTAATARKLGSLWGQSSSNFWAYGGTNYREYMDFRDSSDLVAFHMEAPGTISVRRQPIASPSTLVTTTQLLDASQNLLVNAVNSDSAQNIDRYSVPAGDYFVKFTHVDGAGDYNFRITADYAGDVTGTARDMGDITGSSRQMYDFVGGGPSLPSYLDATDLYKFTIDQTAPLDVKLTVATTPPPTFDANLQLARDLDGNGFISAGEVFAASSNPGDDSISTTLSPGTYYAVVTQNGAYTSYQLDLDSDFDANPGDMHPYFSMEHARTAGTLLGETFFDDGYGVSWGDSVDYIKFDMAAAGRFLGSAFVNPFYSRDTTQPYLRVIKDANNNNRYDVGEEVTPVGASGIFEADLSAGTYYLQMTGSGQQAAYGVRLVPDYAGNTLAAARVMAPISGAAPAPQIFNDYIEQDFGSPENDPDDFYKFTLTSGNQVTLTTTGVEGEDLALSLIKDANNNGLVDAGDVLATSDGIDTPNETITQALAAGDYFVRINGVNGATNYVLTLQAGSAAGLASDFNGDAHVDGADFLAWQRGLGADDPAVIPADGDADGNHNVDAADLAIWKAEFGQDAEPVAAAASAPSATTVMTVASDASLDGSLDLRLDPSSLVELARAAGFANPLAASGRVSYSPQIRRTFSRPSADLVLGADHVPQASSASVRASFAAEALTASGSDREATWLSAADEVFEGMSDIDRPV